MNVAFKLVWCVARGCWVVASEFAKSNAKGKSISLLKSLGLTACLMPVLASAEINNNTNISKTGDDTPALILEISDTSSVDNISINNSGQLTTQGNNSSGIYVENKGSGNTSVKHTGGISTEGMISHGIYVKNEGVKSGQSIDVSLENASIYSKGLGVNGSGNEKNKNGSAIHVLQNNNLGGDVNIVVKESEIKGDYITEDSSVNGYGAIYAETTSVSGNISSVLENTNIINTGGSTEVLVY